MDNYLKINDPFNILNLYFTNKKETLVVNSFAFCYYLIRELSAKGILMKLPSRIFLYVMKTKSVFSISVTCFYLLWLYTSSLKGNFISIINFLKMYLRILKTHEVTQNYVNWFLDNEVTKYSNNQFRNFSLKSQKLYVQDCLNNKDIKLYGIFEDN